MANINNRNWNALSQLRLMSQQLNGTVLKSPKEIVSCMGAMQAQDYNMAKWAIGIRLPNSTLQKVDSALDKGEILRTHVLRPTWHFVAAKDIYWMLELSAPRIKTQLKSRHKELEITPAVLKKGHKIIEKILLPNEFSTREEIVAAFKKSKIAVNDNRASHIFLMAELEGLICSGWKQSTYALLDKRVPPQKKITIDQALARLALKYFSSHGPATVQDFSWWSGLNTTSVRHALELIKNDLVSEKFGEDTYWFSSSVSVREREKDSSFLLPAFDEFIISYKDRSAILSSSQHQIAISSNGIFRPAIFVNGKVAGLWERTIKKDRLLLTTKFFETPTAKIKKQVAKAAKDFGKFSNKKIEFAQ